MSSWIKLKSQNCRDCYKCMRHCRVNAIRFSGNLAYNEEKLCVLCGHCYVSCPQNAKVIVSEVEKAKMLLQTEKVVALVSPTYLAYFNTNYKAFKTAMKDLGFVDYEEETLGYEIVMREYEKILEEHKNDVYITSHCHSLNLIVQKYYPELLSNLMDIVSPMIASAIDIKKRNPEYKVIYIGPCIAKKDEAERYDKLIDCVLMFDEIGNLMKEKNVELLENVEDKKRFKARQAIEYRGMERAMKQISNYHYVSISGVDGCINALKEIRNKKLENVFVFMDMCNNSCLSGPTFQKYNRFNIMNKVNIQNNYGEDVYTDRTYDKQELAKYFEEIKTDIKKPTKEEMMDILKTMGKDKPEKMLNCGTCGYSTCANKAIAIYNGMAELDMCMSYLKEKNESFSDNILKNAPFGVIAVNENMEVQVFNVAACKMFKIDDTKNIIGHKLSVLMDVSDIENCYKDDKSQLSRELYLPDYDKHIEELIVPDTKHKNTIIILKDVSDDYKTKKRKETIDKNVIEIADNVIEKQMKIVQEIASLLGETTAETKVALTKLKESLDR